MVKYDLREMGYAVREKKPRHEIITIMWVAFTVILAALTFLSVNIFFSLIMGYDSETLSDMRNQNPNAVLDFLESNFWTYLILLVVFYCAYLGLKLLLTIIFCSDRFHSIKLKILSDGAMPVCHCREALKVWQTVLVYVLPFILLYSFMLVLCILTLADPFVILIVLFLSFFLAFDMTAVVYVLAAKIKDKVDYIAIDRHVYEMTLYKETYVRIGGKKIKNHIKPIDAGKKRHMFITMTACLNSDCENYAEEVAANIKICPSCGGQIYKAEILTNVVTCLNPDCENYGQELKTDMEKCSLCGEDTGKLAFKFNPGLSNPTIIISIIFAVLFCFIHFIMASKGIETGILADIIDFLRIPAAVIIIFMGFLSKNNAAFITAIMSILITIVFGGLIG